MMKEEKVSVSSKFWLCSADHFDAGRDLLL